MINRENRKKLWENQLQWHFIHHESHMGLNQWLRGENLAFNRPSHCLLT
jgi:hypothetical protein